MMINEPVIIQSTTHYLSINWALMNNCNYKFSCCHSDLNSGSIKAPSYDVVIQFVKKIISHSRKLGLIPYFEFGGGEITMLRYFGGLITFIHERDGLVCIVSNDSKPSSMVARTC